MDVTDQTLQTLAQSTGQLLVQKGMRLATAESCTGGWIAKCCTEIVGSSAWFECGVVSYSNDSKTRFLGVESRLLLDFGAVSEPVVRAMAEGVLSDIDAQIAVAVSGIAGPGGGSDSRPVGSVWIAWISDVVADARLFRFSGNRDQIRRQAVFQALSGILTVLQGSSD